MMTIIVKYSCDLCGLRRVDCEVPAREGEGVIEWMDATIARVCTDHAQRRPGCRPTQLHDLMIPMAGANRVGGPPGH